MKPKISLRNHQTTNPNDQSGETDIEQKPANKNVRKQEDLECPVRKHEDLECPGLPQNPNGPNYTTRMRSALDISRK